MAGTQSVAYINGNVVMSPLSARGREVLALIAEGNSNKEIGAKLGISERTVKNHLEIVFGRLQANNRAHAVVTAIRRGWLTV